MHADFVGQFEDHTLVILVDTHSKWMEVHPVKQATTQVTTHKLRTIFASHGLPEVLVTDNGSVFMSAEFRDFTYCNAIRHITTASCHPSSTGLAE